MACFCQVEEPVHDNIAGGDEIEGEQLKAINSHTEKVVIR